MHFSEHRNLWLSKINIDELENISGHTFEPAEHAQWFWVPGLELVAGVHLREEKDTRPDSTVHVIFYRLPE